MLITLQSNSNSDASNFTNYFKESVVVLPGSEVALVSIAYTFANTIAVGATNSTYNIQLGTENLTVTLTEGNYDKDSFLIELNRSLKAAIDAAAYRTLNAFPSTDSEWDWDVGRTALSLTLAYSPKNWDTNDIIVKSDSATIRNEIDLSDAGMMSTDGSGIIIKTSIDPDSWTTDTAFSSGTANNVIWANALGLPGNPYGFVRFKAMATNYDVFVGVSNNGGVITNWTSGGAGSTQLVAGIRLKSTGQFVVEERDSTDGRLKAITADAAYVVGNEFVISIRELAAPGNFGYTVAGAAINVFIPGSLRYDVNEEELLYGRASLYNQALEDSVVSGGATFFKANVLDTALTVITTAGTGYKENDIITITGDTSAKVMRAYITGIDATGGITSYIPISHTAAWTADETATVNGAVSGGDDAVLTVKVINSAAITDGDVNYIAGVAQVYDAGDNLLGDINIVAVDGGTGAITDFTFTDTLANTGISVGDTLVVKQGAEEGATILINALENFIPRVGGLGWSVVQNTVYRPLMKHQSLQFQPTEAFTTLTLVSAANDPGPTLIADGKDGAGEDREATQILVNIDQFQIASMCKDGGVQKAVACVPYGVREPANAQAEKIDGQFFQEPFNILYHELGNKQAENHNIMQVRLTDAVGNPLVQMLHPTTVTLDLRPRAKF